MKQKYFGLLVFMLIMIAAGMPDKVFGQIIKTTPPATALVGYQYVYNVNVFPLGDSTFYLDEKPTGMTINASTGLVTWTPSAINQGGKVTLRVTVGAFNETQTFYVYVSNAVVCDENMLAYWKLDEPTGITFADFKNGYNAVTSVAPEDTAGVVGLAQKFDPARDIRLSTPDNADQFDWTNGEDFSASVWFRSNHDINSHDGPQIFVGRLGGTGNVNYDHWWWFGLDTNNYVAAQFSNIGMLVDTLPGYPNVLTNHSTYGTYYDDNIWHHAVFTLDANGANNYSLKIYVDGSLKQAFSASKTFVPGDFESIADLNIGWWQNPWSANYEFQGLMDELALYKKALTPAEILAMYNDGLDGLAYCQPGNYAPLFKSQPVTIADEDVQYTYDITVDDYDDADVLTITKESAPAWLTSFTDNHNGTARLRGTPTSTDVGNHSVTLRVSDTKVNIDQAFSIAVANVNDVPVFTSSAVTSVKEDSVYTYSIITEDGDADATLTISAITTLPSWLSLDDNGDGTATLTGTPQNADIGTVNVTLRVTDDQSTYNDQSFSIAVANVNDPPVITGQVALSTNEDENIVLSLNDLTVTDVDNNYPADFALEVSDGEHYTASGTTVTPEENWFGALTVNIALSDLTSTVNGTVNVDVASVNDVPEITSEPVTSATANTAYEYWVSASDVEDQVLTFEAVTLPEWASFSYNTALKLGILQGTPSASDASSADVSIKVTDGDGASDVQDFVITVAGATAIDDIQADDIMVYPSPARNVLHVKSADIQEGTFQILTLSGAMIQEATVNNRYITDIDISNLKSGMYLYRLISNSKQINGKFTKE